MELNQHLDGLALGGIRRFTALAQERGDCILLTLGEPEFDTPAPIRRACREALDRGLTHYTENRGSLPLRRAISQFERRTRNLDYEPEEILITLGATEAIYTALTGVLNPGDEVIIPTPAFSLYDTVARMAGAVPIAVDTAPTGFQLTAAALEAALSPRTKVLVLNSPNNPTGVIYTPENLQAIDRVLGDRPLFVLCDDVYWGLSPCLTFPQVSRRRDRILAVQSFSKPYAMTGWRAGYLMAPQPVLDRRFCTATASPARPPWSRLPAWLPWNGIPKRWSGPTNSGGPTSAAAWGKWDCPASGLQAPFTSFPPSPLCPCPRRNSASG